MAKTRQEMENLVLQLRAEASPDRSRAYRQLSATRNVVIASLLFQARTEDQSLPALSAKDDAIRLLGEWRAVEACSFLVDEINYPTPWPVIRIGRPLSSYPAAEALVEIGSPAIKHIIQRLGNPVSQQQMKLYAFVLCSIEEKDFALARLEKARDGARKASEYEKNLSQLIHLINTIDFHDPAQRPQPPAKPN